jgi:hypothetical protein
MAARGMGKRAAWALLSPCVVLAAASVGTGGGASAPGSTSGPPADAQAGHRLQRARCQALQVEAVRAECLRQADRDLAHRLNPAQPLRPVPPAASAASTPSANRR